MNMTRGEVELISAMHNILPEFVSFGTEICKIRVSLREERSTRPEECMDNDMALQPQGKSICSSWQESCKPKANWYQCPIWFVLRSNFVRC